MSVEPARAVQSPKAYLDDDLASSGGGEGDVLKADTAILLDDVRLVSLSHGVVYNAAVSVKVREECKRGKSCCRVDRVRTSPCRSVSPQTELTNLVVLPVEVAGHQ